MGFAGKNILKRLFNTFGEERRGNKREDREGGKRAQDTEYLKRNNIEKEE